MSSLAPSPRVRFFRHDTPLIPSYTEDEVPALIASGRILPTDSFLTDGVDKPLPVSSRWPAPPPTAPSAPPPKPEAKGRLSGLFSRLLR